MTSRKRYCADGSEVGGQQFTYLFDDIGNRKATGGRASAVSTYTANQLNQIIWRSVPATVDVVGLANPNNDVTLQAGSGTVLTASRKGEYFSGAPVVPAPLPAYPLIQAKTLFGATQTLNAGKTFVPASPEIPTYDADGNLTSDGRWTAYVWDAENRLVEMRRDTATPTGSQQKLTFEYDHQSRRIRKQFWTGNGGAPGAIVWTKQRDTLYLYDGWNLIAELDPTALTTPWRTYAWGTDLSGTLTGAGGVGGLLWVRNFQGATTGHQFVAYDGNGNVAALVQATTATLTAQYEYGPFGESIRMSGALAALNSVRWSSKVVDSESGLIQRCLAR